MSQWCDECHRKPYTGCGKDCPVFGEEHDELTKKYFALLDNLFDVLQLLRNEIRPQFFEWKDADEWLFANLNMTKDEIEEVYRGRNEMIYTASVAEETTIL